jgi:hypothetical protein
MTQLSHTGKPTTTQSSPSILIRWRDAFSDWGALTGQRLLFSALVLLSLVFLTHLGLDMATNTPLETALPRAVTKSVAYISGSLQGDLGQTTAGTITGNPTPITEALPTLLRNSLGLLGASLLLATVVGVTLGPVGCPISRIQLVHSDIVHISDWDVVTQLCGRTAAANHAGTVYPLFW